MTAPSPTTPPPAGRWPRQGETRPPKSSPYPSSGAFFRGKVYWEKEGNLFSLPSQGSFPFANHLRTHPSSVQNLHKIYSRGKERRDPTAQYQLKKHQRKKRNSSEKLFCIQGTVSPSPCPQACWQPPESAPGDPLEREGTAFSLAPLSNPRPQPVARRKLCTEKVEGGGILNKEEGFHRVEKF